MNETLKKRLQELVRGTEKTISARVKENLADIEAAHAAGVPLTVIHRELVKAGFNISYSTFTTCLHRLRKKAKPYTASETNQLKQPSPSQISNDSEPGSNDSEPGSIADIDRIIKTIPDMAALAAAGQSSKKKGN